MASPTTDNGKPTRKVLPLTATTVRDSIEQEVRDVELFAQRRKGFRCGGPSAPNAEPNTPARRSLARTLNRSRYEDCDCCETAVSQNGKPSHVSLRRRELIHRRPPEWLTARRGIAGEDRTRLRLRGKATTRVLSGDKQLRSPTEGSCSRRKRCPASGAPRHDQLEDAPKSVAPSTHRKPASALRIVDGSISICASGT